MSTLPVKYVVDASVAVKLFVEEELSGRAEALFERLATSEESRLYVPDVFFAECANVLWKYVVRFGYASREARRSLSHLYALRLTRVDLCEIVPAALQIALTHSVTVYDACYAATARLVDAPLVTADERLVKRFADTPYRVSSLARLSLDAPSGMNE